MTTSTHKELIDILNEISGGKINEISDKQTQALIDVCALLSQRPRGNVPPPPPPPPLPKTPFVFKGKVPMSCASILDAANLNEAERVDSKKYPVSMVQELEKTLLKRKFQEAKKKDHETKRINNTFDRNAGQDPALQKLQKTLKRQIPKAEENANQKRKVNIVNNAVKRNKGQDLLTQELEKGIKLKPIKTKEKDGQKEEVNTVSKKIQNPSSLSILSIKERFAFWRKG